MKYVHAPGGTYLRTVDESEIVTWDATHQCRPGDLGANEAADLQVYPLQPVTPPPFDRLTQGLREAEPAPDLEQGAWRQQWEVFPLPDEEIARLAADAERQARERAKARRAEAVGALCVTTAAGNTFDGDETSQNRMARAVIALRATDTPTVPWTLADNTVIDASAAELTEALALAGAAQAALWPLE